MKKTLRKALACLLAVLMVVFSVPFSAMAAVTVGEQDQQWWTDEDLPITEAPSYTPWSSSYTFGRALTATVLKNGYQKVWGYKPMIGLTVSNMGTADSTFEEMDNYQNSYYGVIGYADAENAGVLLDPTDLKAGQRIAVTAEIAGFDIIYGGQVNVDFDNTYVQPAGYWDYAVDNDCDTWSLGVDSAVDVSESPYGSILELTPSIDDAKAKVAILCGACKTNATSSNFIGKADARFDAKFDGIKVATWFFEIQQDCDLTQVMTLEKGKFGTIMECMTRDILADNDLPYYYQFSMEGGDGVTSMKMLGPVWTNASGGGSTECTHANLTKTDEVPATCLAAGTAAYWTCKDCGKMFSDASATTEISAPETLAKLNHSYTGAIKSNGDKTHSYLCVNGCNQYGGKVNCNFGEMSIVKPPTITEEGIGRYTCGDCGYYYEVTLDKVTCTHEHTEIRDAKDAELDVPGYTGDTWCLDCGKKIATGTEIPALKGVTVKVDAVDLGTVTLNGEDVTAGAAKRVLAGSKVTLTATPVEGATFVGWVANGSTTVSTDTTFVATALADITYTPVFAIDEADEFTVTFVDSFGNVVSAQTVTSGSAIVVPAAPSRPGYSAATENGWSMTNDEIAALTASATITAQYVKDAEKVFTVTATGCDITVNGVTTPDTAADVAYDTLVTVTAADAKAWAIDGVTVAYGDTYTFFVGSNVTLTKLTNAVTATPTVANVSVTTVTSDITRAVFAATRSMTDDCTFIDAGFVYGKGDLGEITLDDVTGTTVKAAYVKTPVEQFSLVYGLKAQTGTMTARAFLAYVDAEGNTQVIYAAPQTFTY